MALSEIVVLMALATCSSALSPLALHRGDPQEAPTELLQAFGMSQPGVRRWHSEPPQYMLDLYNQVADPSGLTRLPGPYGATVVRAFSERDGGRGNSFAFIVKGLEDNEQLLEAELHIHHSRLQRVHRHLLDDDLYMLELSVEVEGDHQVIAQQRVAAHSSGWRVFQVGSWVAKSMVTPLMSKDAYSHEGQTVFEVHGRTLRGSPLPIVFHHGLQGVRRPLMVLFSSYLSEESNGNHLSQVLLEKGHSGAMKDFEVHTLTRFRRSISTDEDQEEEEEEVEEEEEEAEGDGTTTSPVSTIPSGCERRDMLVDFTAIGWSSWIVSPRSYNAYRCVGHCNFPLGQDLNPTNHATVQSIMNNAGQFPEVQKPCCVPSTYANLSLLYYDAEENVVLKQYDKMVALNCGCH